MEKLALIINSASYDRVEHALTIATMSATLGKEVHVLFTYSGLLRLKKGFTDKIGEETEAWIRETVKAGIKKGSMRKISELLTELQRFGGKIYACPAAMAFHGVAKDELIDEVDKVCGLTTFVEEYASNALTLYI
jgi:peroxiredoxin family protein